MYVAPGTLGRVESQVQPCPRGLTSPSGGQRSPEGWSGRGAEQECWEPTRLGGALAAVLATSVERPGPPPGSQPSRPLLGRPWSAGSSSAWLLPCPREPRGLRPRSPPFTLSLSGLLPGCARKHPPDSGPAPLGAWHHQPCSLNTCALLQSGPQTGGRRPPLSCSVPLPLRCRESPGQRQVNKPLPVETLGHG